MEHFVTHLLNTSDGLYRKLTLTAAFLLLCCGVACMAQDTIEDVDGNVYHTVTLGSQVWTVENLRTTKFNDGTPIPQVTDNAQWKTLASPGLCYYENNPENGKKYGALYNWYVACSDKIAPQGWRVSTHEDQAKLCEYLIANGYNYDGTTEGNKVAKAMTAKTDWDPDPTPGNAGHDLTTNNRTGFTALPTGSRWNDGSFHSIGRSAYWWSSTSGSGDDAHLGSIKTGLAGCGFNQHHKRSGFCIRLVRDAAGQAADTTAPQSPDEWRPLFNGRDLGGWYTWVVGKGKNSDPDKLFQVHDGMIHVYRDAVDGSEMPYGYIATEQEFENYDIRLEYRWGEKKFAPRQKRPRDSGLLYHVVGRDGAYWGAWPRSVECQIQEGDTGDICAVQARLTTTLESDTSMFKLNGTPKTINEGIIKHSRNSQEVDGWNRVEVQVRGNCATHIVNGTVNAIVTDIGQPDPSNPANYVPLSRGKLLLQAEGAEIFYRNVEIRQLPPASAAPVRQQAVEGIDESVMSRLGWKVAVQCYTYHTLTLFETLEQVQGLGIHYVELLDRQRISKDIAAPSGPGMDAATMARVKAKLAETGIKAVAVWVDPLPRDEAGLRKLFAWTKEMGIEVVTTEPDPSDKNALALMARLCAEYQVKIAVHNHWKPTAYWNPEFALSVVKDYQPWIGLCPDTGHWFRSGLSTMDGLKRVEGHIVSMHFKDIDRDKRDVPFGTGVNHAAEQLAELRRQGFKGVITIEYEAKGDHLQEDLLKCVSFLNDNAARLTTTTK